MVSCYRITQVVIISIVMCNFKCDIFKTRVYFLFAPLVLARNSEILLQAGKEEVCLSVKSKQWGIFIYFYEIKAASIKYNILFLFSADAQAVLWTWTGCFLLWSEKRQTDRDQRAVSNLFCSNRNLFNVFCYFFFFFSEHTGKCFIWDFF